ncbi:Protein CBG07395 [Caenorhabditis briggsae]|uniref:Protein CBG07395 n=1 Tax=Caenorhabditis briggsae TaxID=6238 RepID=A8X4V2_CAEBR|nr:Protein CBG07395 [Caenorhabditis briggsae]CAP27662.2 Protein CBG07395 [Caenorhabditis briggsae]
MNPLDQKKDFRTLYQEIKDQQNETRINFMRQNYDKLPSWSKQEVDKEMGGFQQDSSDPLNLQAILDENEVNGRVNYYDFHGMTTPVTVRPHVCAIRAGAMIAGEWDVNDVNKENKGIRLQNMKQGKLIPNGKEDQLTRWAGWAGGSEERDNQRRFIAILVVNENNNNGGSGGNETTPVIVRLSAVAISAGEWLQNVNTKNGNPLNVRAISKGNEANGYNENERKEQRNLKIENIEYKRKRGLAEKQKKRKRKLSRPPLNDNVGHCEAACGWSNNSWRSGRSKHETAKVQNYVTSQLDLMSNLGCKRSQRRQGERGNEAPERGSNMVRIDSK